VTDRCYENDTVPNESYLKEGKLPMTVTLHLPPHLEQAYRAEAQARGIPLDEVVREILVAAPPPTPVPELAPEEWVHQFQAWTRSHTGNDLPVLSDEAISREAIYRERGL
jgi:hypothetical protein